MKEQEKKYPSTTEIKNLRVLKILFPIVVTTIVERRAFDRYADVR